MEKRAITVSSPAETARSLESVNALRFPIHLPQSFDVNPRSSLIDSRPSILGPPSSILDPQFLGSQGSGCAPQPNRWFEAGCLIHPAPSSSADLLSAWKPSCLDR